MEQNAAMALALAGRGYLLATGGVMAQSDTATLRANDYARHIWEYRDSRNCYFNSHRSGGRLYSDPARRNVARY